MEPCFIPQWDRKSREPPRDIKGLHFPWAKWHAHNRKELSKLWIIWDMSRREENAQATIKLTCNTAKFRETVEERFDNCTYLCWVG